MDEPEMREIASIMADVLKAPDDAGGKEKARGRVRDLMQRFPVYP
jgi:glycine/serine hydroxymethyltransferase